MSDEKENARFIHYASKRSHKPFEAVNCAALAPSLLESEPFGHEKGAFSGAVAQHIGERPKDIASLAKYYVGHLCESLDVQGKSLSEAVLKRLEGYDYPGNIRELINVLERAVILSRDARVLDPEHIHFGAVSAQPDQPDFGLDEDTEADDFELRRRACS